MLRETALSIPRPSGCCVRAHLASEAARCDVAPCPRIARLADVTARVCRGIDVAGGCYGAARVTSARRADVTARPLVASARRWMLIPLRPSIRAGGGVLPRTLAWRRRSGRCYLAASGNIGASTRCYLAASVTSAHRGLRNVATRGRAVARRRPRGSLGRSGMSIHRRADATRRAAR